jgi:hypothetical protein
MGPSSMGGFASEKFVGGKNSNFYTTLTGRKQAEITFFPAFLRVDWNQREGPGQNKEKEPEVPVGTILWYY